MPSEPEYVFTRDYIDNNRINLQHYLWVELFGYLTHPKIPTSDPDLRIADIGTGTGIWLTDLEARLPNSVQLDALDVSFAATPPPKWIPSNVTLRYWDVKADVPEDLVGVYDIVHIRNFAFVLTNNDVQRVTESFVRMLRPGGYLQWGEVDVASFRIETLNPDTNVEALQELLRLSQGQDSRLKPTWVPRLPDLLSDVGLVEVESDVKDAPPHLALAKHECNLLMHHVFINKTPDEALAQALAELLPKVARETREGAYWAFTRWTVIGRKPIGL
ncbi:hypothetical protein DL769_000066 [Monosporascus sp. CRB-8-3]|nr:hypothetical protein DL769_000066 [Monosporascus sp. CRB-8-3]